MAELAELFLDGLEARIASMRNAWDRGDLSAIRFAAHQLRGAAGGYGFPEIGDAAGCLEDLLRGTAREETADESDAALEDVRTALAQLERRHGAILAAAIAEPRER